MDFTGWLAPAAEGRAASTYLCLAPPPVRYAFLGANAAGVITRLPTKLAFVERGPCSVPSNEPVDHWIVLRRHGTLLAARTVRG